MPITALNYNVIDSGPLVGDQQMAIDRDALHGLADQSDKKPTLRFFQWTEPTISYGYLLDIEKVKIWSTGYGPIPFVKRPTGGGAVFHSPSDLSLSLLWPKESHLFSETPRTCYAEIHSRILDTLHSFDLGETLSLHSAPKESCEKPKNLDRFSVCFTEPVCNDVMLNSKKVVGGALRITKSGTLYQGTLQLNGQVELPELKNRLTENFTHGF